MELPPFDVVHEIACELVQLCVGALALRAVVSVRDDLRVLFGVSLRWFDLIQRGGVRVSRATKKKRDACAFTDAPL